MTTVLLTEKLASFFVGIAVSTILYGTTIGQSLWYFSVFSSDSKWSLAFVGSLLFLDTAHMAIMCIAAYYTLLGYVDPLRMQSMLTWSIPASIAITYGLTFAVQCFFVLRVWILSRRNKAITISIAVLVLMQIASGIITVARETRNDVEYITDHTKIAATFELSSCLLANVAITTVLVYYLQRSRITGVSAWTANPVINRLIFFTISTGFLTSIVTMANLILFLAAPESYYWVVPHVISSKLYVTSLLSTLNSRRSVRDLMIRNSSLYPSAPAKEMIVRTSMPLQEKKSNGHRKPVRKGVMELFSEFMKRSEGKAKQLGDTSVEMELLPGSPQPSKLDRRPHSRSFTTSPTKSDITSTGSKIRDSGISHGSRDRTHAIRPPGEWQRDSEFTESNLSKRSSRFTALTFATTNNASNLSRHPYRTSTLGATTPVTPSSALHGFSSYSHRASQDGGWSDSLKNRLSKSNARPLPPVPPIPEASVAPPTTSVRKVSTSFGPPPPVAFTQLSRSSRFSRFSGSSGSARSTPRLGSLRFPSEIQLDEAFTRGDDWASSVGSGKLSLGVNRFN